MSEHEEGSGKVPVLSGDVAQALSADPLYREENRQIANDPRSVGLYLEKQRLDDQEARMRVMENRMRRRLQQVPELEERIEALENPPSLWQKIKGVLS